ncbi:MAG: dTDP-4-dehydrorhamnose 3,5-epimerase family protein, partial [Terracoccus sp.]
MVDIAPFEVTETSVEGLLLLRMKTVTEPRGVVREAFRASAFLEGGAYAGPWKQVNITETVRGAIRGFHGEHAIKVVAVAAGSAFGAYLDTRPDSATFGQVVTVELTPGIQVQVPAGVCNAFQATSAPSAQYLYLFSEEW